MFGEAVKRERESQKLSQRSLASMVGTSQARIWEIEAGLANPSLEAICKIADGLGVKVSDLVQF